MSDKMNLQEAIERVETQNSIDRLCDCDECIEARGLVLEAAKLWSAFHSAEPACKDIHDAVKTGDDTGVF